MEWLNYHHLRYFWMVAKEGGLARAAKKLHVSQPSISEQIRELESSLGEKLFERAGRNNKLTEAGHVVYGFADEIFSLGREMLSAVKQRPGTQTLRLHVGVVDSFPKLVTHEILKPVFAMPQPVHVVCREGKMEDLLGQLAAHRLDILLVDEPVSSSVGFKTFNHPLGETSTTFCAEAQLAKALRKGFPHSLRGAPALLPVEQTPFRRALELWFRNRGIQPRVVAEFEDLAMMLVMAAEGRGFIPIPTVAAASAVKQHDFEVLARVKECRVAFYATTVERRMVHPGVLAICNQAKRILDS